MSGDHNMYQKTKSYLDDFECPRCGHCCQALETEPFEYWSVAEGWVKIDEVREHFEIAGCGTIYKSGGEGRVPLYTAPPKQWVGLTDEEVSDVIDNVLEGGGWLDVARALEAAIKRKNT